jgi:pimeloyl-ACP methyl ester carboxylesterase
MSMHRVSFRATLFMGCVLVGLLTLTGCPKKPSGDSANTNPPTATENNTDPQWVVRQQTQAKVAIVFVHGIFGDTIGTWTNANGTRFFDLVAADPAIVGKADIFAFGYPSRMFKSGSFDIREAANRLHGSLDNAGVFGYSKIVFVAHSMGGLVTMHELLVHRELLSKVPVLVFLATPQEGADVTRIAKYIANNPALSQMTPADNNTMLQTLSDTWNSLTDKERPMVQCAYESRDTFGVRIVAWSSATRFCKGAPMAVDANHIDIVKPDRATQDAVITVTNALKNYVFNQSLDAKLETPDFQPQGDHDLLVLSSIVGKQPARLINAGGSELRLTLADISDSALLLWPDQPTELAPNSMQYMHLALGSWANKSEYQFTLRTGVAPDRLVIVRVPDGLRGEQAALMRAASADIVASLSDPEKAKRFGAATADPAQAPTEIVNIVHERVALNSPDLPADAQWVVTADVLNAFNWSGLAVRALRQAEKSSASVTRIPGVLNLAAVAAMQSGESRVFESTQTPVLANADIERLTQRNGLIGGYESVGATQLASRLQTVPALKVFGLSLQGDVLREHGNMEAARQAYQDAAVIRPTPSISHRLQATGGWRSDIISFNNGTDEKPADVVVGKFTVAEKPKVKVLDGEKRTVPVDSASRADKDKSTLVVQPAK